RKGRKDMRTIAIGLVLSLSLLIGGRVASGASCDATIEKAKGKLVSCACTAIAKEGLAAGEAVVKCDETFQKACMKAKTIGGCTVQTKDCNAAESDCDYFWASHCANSPSGAFLDQ